MEVRICICRICPKRSLKVKSMMALYLKIHFMRYTNHVQNVMLLSKSTQLFAMLLYYYAWTLQTWWYLMQNTFGVNKAWPSKVESYLEVNTRTDWWQQDLTSEYDQGLAYWTHQYYTGHIIASYCFQTLIGLANLCCHILLQISYILKD